MKKSSDGSIAIARASPSATHLPLVPSLEAFGRRPWCKPNRRDGPSSGVGSRAAAGAARGLFSGSAGVAGKISTHAERLADTRPDTVEWSLLLGGVDLGALRLLANMLACRRFDSAEIVADGCVGGAVTQSAMLSYPSCIPPQEFTFVHDPPAKSHSERGVRLIFADEPDDVTLDLVIASLDTWGNVMMAGGYDGDSGANAFANKAALEESCVVGVSLMVSGVNELMFSPVVNLARRVHALYAPLERLKLV